MNTFMKKTAMGLVLFLGVCGDVGLGYGASFSSASAASAAHGDVLADKLAMTGVFEAINPQQARALYYGLLENDALHDTPALRFFEILANSEDELVQRQLAYHLTVLTALGGQVNTFLRQGEYTWVLDDDESGRDKRKPDNLYAYYGNSENNAARQSIWDVMKKVGFVKSEIDFVDVAFYNPIASIKALVEQKQKAGDTVFLYIGANGIPSYYKAADPRGLGKYSSAEIHAFGSCNYDNYSPNAITVGVDHRHRPSVLANVLNRSFWSEIKKLPIDVIWFCEEDGLIERVKPLLPKDFPVDKMLEKPSVRDGGALIAPAELRLQEIMNMSKNEGGWHTTFGAVPFHGMLGSGCVFVGPYDKTELGDVVIANFGKSDKGYEKWVVIQKPTFERGQPFAIRAHGLVHPDAATYDYNDNRQVTITLEESGGITLAGEPTSSVHVHDGRLSPDNFHLRGSLFPISTFISYVKWKDINNNTPRHVKTLHILRDNSDDAVFGLGQKPNLTFADVMAVLPAQQQGILKSYLLKN